MKLFITFLAIFSLLFPPLPQRGGQVIISPAPVSGGNTNASWVQTCAGVIGGSGDTVTLSVGSGGSPTAGCSTTFTAGNCFVVDYTVYKVSDLTTGNIGASGATITWHQAGSVHDSSPAWEGSFYACGADIVSPNNPIIITVTNTNGTYWGFTLTEVHGPTTLDTGGFVSNTGTSGTTVTVGPSSTLTNTNEYIDAFTRLGGSYQTLTGGSCFGGTATIPTNGQSPGTVTFAAGHFIPASTTAGSCAFGSSAGDTYGMILTILK